MTAWLAILALVAAVGWLLWLMTSMPGRSYAGPLAPLSGEGRALALRLRLHVAALAANERYADLATPARYIEAALAKQGYTPQLQEFQAGGRRMRNIEAGSGTIVVGAHYDTVPGSPGADDNASGVAVLLELAAMKLPVRFVAFAHEEVPHANHEEMGSWAWAKRARERGERIDAMFSLEMLGYYSDAAGSQRYPPPLGLLYPDRGNFIAFVADLGSRNLVRKSISHFREKSKFPSEGVAAPSFIPGVTWSDHWPFRRQGYDAIMLTDTAFNRNPHYHRPSDTPDKLDYDRMARVALGLAEMFKEMARESR